MSQGSLALTPQPESRKLATLAERNLATRSYSIKALREHLEEKLNQDKLENRKHPWSTVDELARIFNRRADERNRKLVRIRLSKAFRPLLNQGLFLLFQYDVNKQHRKILGCKLAEPGKLEDRQYGEHQLKGMIKRKEINAHQINQAQQILGFAG